ncbi:MAG: hypothetical protein ACI91G_001229, partial [Gammaproteobacteria bacterium]
EMVVQKNQKLKGIDAAKNHGLIPTDSHNCPSEKWCKRLCC